MSFFLIAVVMPILAQADQAGKIYEFSPKKGGETFFAYIIDDKNPISLKIRYAEPGRESVIDTKLKTDFDWVEISPERAQKAITAKMDKTSVDVGGGVRVAKEEVARAEKAREWSHALEARLKPSAVATAVSVDQKPAPTASRPPFLKLWGPQIALAIGAIALVGIIVKLVILSD